MHYSIIPTSLSPKTSQQQVVEFLKNKHHDCIQTSGGLCVKSEATPEELKTQLCELDADLVVRTLNDEEKEKPDVQAFMRN